MWLPTIWMWLPITWMWLSTIWMWLPTIWMWLPGSWHRLPISRATSSTKFSGVARAIGSHFQDSGSHIQMVGSHIQMVGSHIQMVGSHIQMIGSHIQMSESCAVGSAVAEAWKVNKEGGVTLVGARGCCCSGFRGLFLFFPLNSTRPSLLGPGVVKSTSVLASVLASVSH